MSEESIHVEIIEKKKVANRKRKSAKDVEEVGVTSRRSWTKEEDEALIIGLNQAIDAGLLTQNGFKYGFLGFLEKVLHSKFPGTDIRADPYICSRITVWRKQYGFLYSLLQKSGIGFNDETCVVECDQEQWDIASKAEVGWKKKKGNSWPLYRDWQRIFGKDRATGSRAKDFRDTTTDPSNPNVDVNPNRATPGSSKSMPETTPHLSTHSNSVAEDQVTSKPSKNKRKTFSNDDSEFLATFNKFCDNSQLTLSNVGKSLGVWAKLSDQRARLWDELSEIADINIASKVILCKKFANNPSEMEIFFGMPKEGRVEMISHMLDEDS